MKRHKWIVECQLPLCEQPGAVQCAKRHRWLRSSCGLAIHKCLNVSSSSSLTMSSSSSTLLSIRSSSLASTDCTSSQIPEPDRTCCCCHCSQCGRCFKFKPGFQCNNCHRGKRCSEKTAVNLPCLAHVEDVCGGSRTYRDISADSNYHVFQLSPYIGWRGRHWQL